MTTATQKAPPFREQVSPGQWRVNWNWPQMRFAQSEARVPVLQAGVRAGKTSGLVEVLAQKMQKIGPGDYLFAEPTFPLLRRAALGELTERLTYVTRGTRDQFKYEAANSRFRSLVEKPNGEPETVLWLGSADNPESLAATTLKGAAFDEAAQTGVKREAFLQIFRGLAIDQGPLLIGTTIYGFGDAYKAEIYDKWVAGDPTYEIIQADSIENPAFPQEEWYRLMEDLPPWLFNMRYRGIYERPTGLIYDVFDERTQKIPRFDLRLPQYKEWKCFTGHDFGPNNTGMLVFAQDPASGLVYLIDEYLRGDGLSIQGHAERFKERTEGLTVLHRTGGAARKQEQEIRDGYRAAGWPIHPPGIEGVEAGILQCYSFMAKNQLFVFNDCYGFLNEISRYSRKLDENYEVTDDIQGKASFHLMDAMRYGLDWLPRERVAGQGGIKIQTFRGGRKDRRRGTPISKRTA